MSPEGVPECGARWGNPELREWGWESQEAQVVRVCRAEYRERECFTETTLEICRVLLTLPSGLI